MNSNTTKIKGKRVYGRVLTFGIVMNSSRVTTTQTCAKIRSCTRDTLARLTNNKEGDKGQTLVHTNYNLTKEWSKTYQNLKELRVSHQWLQNNTFKTCSRSSQGEMGSPSKDGDQILQLHQSNRPYGRLDWWRWSFLASSSPILFLSSPRLWPQVLFSLKDLIRALVWELRRWLWFLCLSWGEERSLSLTG